MTIEIQVYDGDGISEEERKTESDKTFSFIQDLLFRLPLIPIENSNEK